MFSPISSKTESSPIIIPKFSKLMLVILFHKTPILSTFMHHVVSLNYSNDNNVINQEIRNYSI